MKLTEERIEELAARRGAHWSIVIGWLNRVKDEDGTRGSELENLEEDLRRNPDWTHATVMAIQTGILEHFAR